MHELSNKASAWMGDFWSLRIEYFRKYGIQGRRYARGLAAQSLSKHARAVAFAGMCDVDVRNCQPSLMRNMLVEALGSERVPAECPNSALSW